MADLNKIVEELSKLTVLEAADLAKKLEEAWGVSAAAATVSVAAAAPAEAAEEKTDFDVVLLEAGANKINVIKALRSVTSLSLGDAKNGAENVPFVIAEAASKDDAHKIKKALEEVGAKVELA